MKIAILSFYSGRNKRGVERWVRELAYRLALSHEVAVYQNWPPEDKFEYKVITTGLPFEFDKKRKSPSILEIPFLDYKSRKKGFFALKLLPKLWREGPDVIIPTDGGWEPAFVRVLSWLKGAKMVIVGHAGMGWDDANNLWAFPNVFVALSSAAQRWAKRVNPLVRVKHIPDGVDLNKFKPQGKKYTLGLKKPVILCASALIPTKRVDLTLKAVAKLRGVSLLVAGSGRLEKEILNLGKRLLGERFMLSNFNFDEMPSVYKSANLVTIASIPQYSFEMVLLEAMATNLPVVANEDHVRREIVGNAGILVDPTDTEAYAKALEKALSTDWGDTPRRQAEKFSWDKVVGQYEKLFESLFQDSENHGIQAVDKALKIGPEGHKGNKNHGF